MTFLCVTEGNHYSNSSMYHNVVVIYLLTFYLFSRFLCHVPVVYVDYPGSMSLTQLYGTFNRAML